MLPASVPTRTVRIVVPNRCSPFCLAHLPTQLHRLSTEAVARYSDIPPSAHQTAVFLPCSLFVGSLNAGVLTDFDLRKSVLGASVNDEGGCVRLQNNAFKVYTGRSAD